MRKYRLRIDWCSINAFAISLGFFYLLRALLGVELGTSWCLMMLYETETRKCLAGYSVQPRKEDGNEGKAQEASRAVFNGP